MSPLPLWSRRLWIDGREDGQTDNEDRYYSWLPHCGGNNFALSRSFDWISGTRVFRQTWEWGVFDGSDWLNWRHSTVASIDEAASAAAFSAQAHTCLGDRPPRTVHVLPMRIYNTISRRSCSNVSFSRLRRMHKLQTIATDVRGACLSVCPSVYLSVTRLNSASLCKNDWIDQNPVWSKHSWGPGKHCVRRGAWSPTARERDSMQLSPNYFGRLFFFAP